jgi:hypothetical protein
MTQWPIKPTPNPANPPASVSNTFPGTSNCPLVVPPASTCTAFANITLETFDQVKVGTGCMNCHNAVSNNDFLWSLQMNAFAPPGPKIRTLLTSKERTGAFHDLQALLNSTVEANKAMSKVQAKKSAAKK